MVSQLITSQKLNKPGGTCGNTCTTAVSGRCSQTQTHTSVQLLQMTTNIFYWVTLTLDLAFRWAFRWAKVRFKSKSKVISLSKRLIPNLRSKYRLRLKLSWTLV